MLVLVARHRSADKGSYVCRHRISFSGDGACVWVGGVGLSLEGVEWSVICSAGRRDFVIDGMFWEDMGTLTIQMYEFTT